MGMVALFLSCICYIYIIGALIILIINKIRKKPLKKIMWSILGSHVAVFLFMTLSGYGVYLAFVMLACALFIDFFGLLILMIIKAIQKETLKKNVLGILGSFVGAIFLTIIATTINPEVNCKHEFAVIEKIDSTCSIEGFIQKKCSKCKKEEKEVLPLIDHKWNEPTCEKAKSCLICGLSEGEKSDHKWDVATCVRPKTCSVCKITEGEALSAEKVHKWKEATCTEPKTCVVCDTIEGTTVEHIGGDWEIVDAGTVELQGTRQLSCTVCKEIFKTEKFDSNSKILFDIIKRSVEMYSGTADTDILVENEYVSATVAVLCENNEKVVMDILAEISDQIPALEFETGVILAFGDIEEGDDAECLAMATIDSDGVCNLSPTSVNFKTERNEWITKQFSAWDGSHRVLEKLIVDNLNDEDSYKHIETTYIDVNSVDRKNEVNNMLKQAGYAQRVDVDDLFVMTTFSAKNAFNATIKNTAFGIVDYDSDVVTLIGVE